MLDNAPWETAQPAEVVPPTHSSPQRSGGGLEDIERLLSLGEGIMERMLPRMMQFMTTVNQIRSGQIPGQQPQPELEQPNVVEASAPAVGAETVYATIFDLLNLVPDEMTCDEMRTWVRDNKPTVMMGLRARLGG